MRIVQIVLFFIGLLSFVAAVFFVGEGTGDTLWRVGIAVILLDLACTRIWPSPQNR
jgi:hypothetical protein